MTKLKISVILTLIATIELSNGLRQYTKSDILRLRGEVTSIFYHAYDGYLTHADGYDELRPLSCSGVNSWSSSSLTLIDALDTLAVIGNFTEFRRVVDHLTTKVDFDKDINVSVFETNIRIVGGLLSAHLLSHKAGVELEAGYPCNGPLLRLAEKVARKLLPAFDTKTGMPYGTVNLKYGVPEGETSVTCTAGIGTFIVEFGALSRLTGDPIYEEVALNALHSLYHHRSAIGLLGNHIDVMSGSWTAQDAGIGAGVDSYYEYLVKGAIMLNRPELLHMFEEGRVAIDKYLKRDDWHIWASMSKGQLTLPVFQSLQAFWPGLLSLLGDISSAMKSLHNMHNIWKQYGFLPEFYNIPNAEAGLNRDSYPLRPELIESVMYLYRATGDPYLLEVGEDILKSIQYSAKTSCGYATIKNVRDHRKQDTMESFFLAETTKYLYLLFDPDNFLNSDGGYGTVFDTQNGECIIESSYIFNTEAHPIDVGALKCCHDVPRESLVKGFNRKKFLGEATATIDTKAESLEDVLEPKIELQEVSEHSTEDLKKMIMKELFGASMKAKKKLEELQKRFEPMLKSEEKEENFELKIDIIDQNETESPEETFEEVDNSTEVEDKSIEVVKIPPTLDSDNVDTHTKSELKQKAGGIRRDRRHEELANPPVIDSSREVKITKPPSDSSNSMLTDFVKTILKTSQKPKKFDAQQLLEKIRDSKFPRNATWETKYEMLTCKAQPYLQRISVMGEFY